MAYTTINKSSVHFNTKLYTGTGSSLALTGLGFEPSMTWIKCRSGSASAEDHVLFDAVRGSTKRISPNTSTAEWTSATNITSFDSDGFTLSTNTQLNGSGEYASWNWKANGAGSANTDGSINTTATSANTTSGFSISTYTGTGSNATVGHGLGVTPKMIIVKRLNGNDAWWVYNEAIGNGAYLVLDSAGASSTSGASGLWNSTSPTSSVFSVGTNGGVNASGGTYVAYCFAEKTGYSKFGSYKGNSSTDGTFVYTGFKPSFLLIKNTSATQGWWQWDNKRIGYNGGGNHRFRTNGNDSEFTDATSKVDLLSNGFKWRDGDNAYNYSGNTFIYMAFAEAPLVGSNGVTAKAR